MNPSFSISTLTTSPTFNTTGGFIAMPTPLGVPEKMMSPASTGILLPRYLVQDIDTEEDWKQAELMHQALALSNSL